MNIFFVQSPLQLLSAIEAREFLSSKKNDLLVIDYSKNKRNNEQINKLLEYYKWDKIQKFLIHISTKERIIQYLLFVYKILKQKDQVDSLFIGDYRSDCMWMTINNIKPKKVYLLDDGTANLGIEKIFLNINEYNVKRIKNKDFIFKLFRLNNANRLVVDLFSMFEYPTLTHINIIKNSFPYLQQNIKELDADNNTVYFIGTWITMPGFITEKYFFELFSKILNYYDGKTVVFIPHRRESTKAFSCEFPNVKIERFENIIELEFLLKKIRPNYIATFFSTALITLKNIYNVENVDSFLFDLNKLDKHYYDSTKKTYEYYTNKFNVIDLEKI